MIYNFLSEYLSIIIFLFIALFLSIGFIFANFLASPQIQIQKNYPRMNVVLMHLMTLEWNLMLDSIWLQFYL